MINVPSARDFAVGIAVIFIVGVIVGLVINQIVPTLAKLVCP